MESRPNASTNEAAAVTQELPERLVRPESDSTGELLHWEAVRKLRISHVDPLKPIHLRQIEIYGCDGINYALKSNGGSAAQSSTMGDGKYWGPAELVIDGDRENYVNHTAHQADGWLEVTLAAAVNVESFAICNMIDLRHDHRMRLAGHLVELIDENDRVVYHHAVDPEIDRHLFDPAVKCRQRFVNEEANLVFATLLITPESPGMAKVTAVKMSGETISEVLVDIKSEGAAAFLCQQIAEAVPGVAAYRLRLMLPDGQVWRQNAEGDLGGQAASLLELFPEIEEMNRTITNDS